MRNLVFATLIVFLSFGCSDNHQHSYDYPLPVDDPTAYNVEYIVKSDFNSLKEAAKKVLGQRYDLYTPKDGMTAYDTPFWNIKGKEVEYEQNGVKHKKSCYIHVFQFDIYPGYSSVAASCEIYAYVSDLGRGGVHNLFNVWWDWYPEQSLYLEAEILEDLLKELNIDEGSVIRLRKTYKHEEEVELIRINEEIIGFKTKL